MARSYSPQSTQSTQRKNNSVASALRPKAFGRRAVLSVVSLLLTLAAPAAAQQLGPCAPRADAVAKLAAGYGEVQAGIGLGAGGRSVVELYVSESGSFTILVTQPNGLACIAAAGDGWQAIAAAAGEGT